MLRFLTIILSLWSISSRAILISFCFLPVCTFISFVFLRLCPKVLQLIRMRFQSSKTSLSPTHPTTSTASRARTHTHAHTSYSIVSSVRSKAVPLLQTLFICTSQGRFQREVRGVPTEPPFDSKFHFRAKFWINLINLGYRIHPKYLHPVFFTLYSSLTSPFYYLSVCVKLLDE